MAELADSVLADFIEETQELLARLGAAGRERERERDGPRRREVELSLHTIKGNARTFGFTELSDAASELLERLRREQGGEPVTGASGEALLGEFVERGREFLNALGKQGGARQGFFQSLLEVFGKGRHPSGPREKTGAPPPAEADPASLLAAAPPVHPRIHEIIALARRELERDRSGITSGFCPDEAVEAMPRSRPIAEVQVAVEEVPVEAAPGAVSSSVKQGEAREPGRVSRESMRGISGRLFGYALEARTFSEEDRRTESGPRDALSDRALELLGSLARAAEELLRAPSGDALAQTAAFRRLETSAPGGVRLETADPVARLSPEFGELLLDIAAVVCRSIAAGEGAAGLVRVVVKHSARRWFVALRGVVGLHKPAVRLKLFSIERWIEDLGGSLGQDSRSNDITIELPDEFDVADVLRARSSAGPVAFPSHRVVDVLENVSLAGGTRPEGPPRLRYGERDLDVIDLTRGGPHAGPATAVVLRSGSGCQAFLVEGGVEAARLLVRLPGRGKCGDGVLGFCVEAERRTCFPLLLPALV